MNKLIVANFKMNPDSDARAERLIRGISGYLRRTKNTEVVVCPPFIYLYLLNLKRKTQNLKLGAQDCFWEDKGAWTGEVSAHQLMHMRVEYVIIGHSERRALGETDEKINKKVKSALRNGLKVILCVGEPLSVRRKGLPSAKRFVSSQLKKDLTGIRNSKFEIQNFIVAYEPVWAIGTGRADKPTESNEMARFIKQRIAKGKSQTARVIYGGSVTPQNAYSILREPEINGALVGGASLSSAKFGRIIKIADKV